VTKRVYFASITVFLTVMAGLIQSGINQLDTATAQQCKAQAWPEHQHQAHMAFCAKEGYPTN
jgi:hypothetical protein